MHIEINGLSIQYIDEGASDKPVIVLLHGWGCHGEVYRLLIDHLKPRYRVIIPDFPGFGGSAEPPVPWGALEYAEFVLAFCAKLQLREVNLFGHSHGGRVIIKLFSLGAPPISVPKIVLTGSSGIVPSKTAAAKRKTKLYKIGRTVLSNPAVHALFPDALEEYRKKHGSADYLAASPMMRQCLVKLVNEDLTPALPMVSPSVLLIWGDRDDQTPLSFGQLMEEKMPDAGLAVIQNAGHYAFLDQWRTFSAILDAFL